MLEKMEGSECSEVLKALADPTRRRIISALLDDGLSVNALSERISVPQYQTSKHLRVLKEARIVDVLAEGKTRTYSIVPELRLQLRGKNPALDFGCCSFSVDTFLRRV